jgi:hypothetical protein
MLTDMDVPLPPGWDPSDDPPRATTRLRDSWRAPVAGAAAIAIAHATSLYLMVGYIGASRALTLGPTVYIAEQAPALVTSFLAALLVALLAQGMVRGTIATWRALVVLGAAYVAIAALSTELVGELTLLDVPLVLQVITGLGGVLAAAWAGLSAGTLLRRLADRGS